MKKDKKPEKEKKGNKEKSAKSFLKKRAPIYLAIITMLIVFVVPELTAGSLQDHIPNDLTGGEKEALEVFLAYRGPNNFGLNPVDALSEKIADDYPDEKIFDSKDTVVMFSVSESSESTGDEYQIILDFKTKKENTVYEWIINTETGDITSVTQDAKKIIEIVDYSK